MPYSILARLFNLMSLPSQKCQCYFGQERRKIEHKTIKYIQPKYSVAKLFEINCNTVAVGRSKRNRTCTCTIASLIKWILLSFLTDFFTRIYISTNYSSIYNAVYANRPIFTSTEHPQKGPIFLTYPNSRQPSEKAETRQRTLLFSLLVDNCDGENLNRYSTPVTAMAEEAACTTINEGLLWYIMLIYVLYNAGCRRTTLYIISICIVFTRLNLYSFKYWCANSISNDLLIRPAREGAKETDDRLRERCQIQRSREREREREVYKEVSFEILI